VRTGYAAGAPAADSHASYWVEKLGRFRHGPRLLPGVLPAGRACVSAVHVSRPSAAAGASAETIGLAAFVLVLSRYNGGEPLVIASPASGDKGLIFFASSAGSDNQPADRFLECIRAELEESRRHQPCRLEDVASGLALTTSELERALLQLGFAFGPAEPVAGVRARAGVVLYAEPRGRDLHLEVTVNAAAYSPTLLPQMAAHISRAAEWLAGAKGAPLSQFKLLSADEEREIARHSNGPRVALDKGLTLHGLVAAQAARTPGATAVMYGDIEVSYAALDAQANHLATMLRRDFGVTPGARVGVMMERSEQTVAALYGVMKAGAAYVPINPRHPWETIRYMLENAVISVLIVDSESIASASSFAGQLLVIDIELRETPDAADPAVPVSEDDLAYVIYTSGSTGRPKGVAIQHRAIVNTVLWRNDFYGIGPSDVNLQIPSFAFDSSVVDIFCVLVAGGRLIIPDEEMRLDARRLLELSIERGVTSCIVTPSYYKLLVGELAGAVPSLRCVTLAGESATPELVAAHLETLPGVALFNEYGPTENAVCSTACRLETPVATVPIGRPIWNVAVLILDAAGRLAPIGVPGEIFLGGAGVARGYLNQETLTAERFVPSPVPAVCGGTLYKTGDRACWALDGSLEFLGRLDNQVKIRGFRIELDEVEQALRLHPDVRHAAVLCKEDAQGAKYLAGYVEGPAELTRPQLREHVGTRLPYYMIPDALVVMPQLPLNLNGKIDRTSLGRLDDFSTRGEVDIASLSPVQAILIGLWADVLKRGQIALDDNFFAMGGNSLRVMEVTSRIRGELAPGIELLDIYTYPTVRELADRLAQVG